MAADGFERLHGAVAADNGVDLDDALDARLAGQRRVEGAHFAHEAGRADVAAMWTRWVRSRPIVWRRAAWARAVGVLRRAGQGRSWGESFEPSCSPPPPTKPAGMAATSSKMRAAGLLGTLVGAVITRC